MSRPLLPLLQEKFGFSSFRPGQEAVCDAAAAGRDVLLVMPTGAGKSLCYQLPGFARGGVSLVISPLVALIEDQVGRLQQRGFRAERIHSGRPREQSREVCARYLRGDLDFLFIAPERLAVPGFPEMLARRLPVLIAVDEAHCISQWGHDFRPDYLKLGERLTPLRAVGAVPILALTATATPAVQDDIVLQLALKQEARFIRGFRRENIGIQVVALDPSQRSEGVRRILADKERRPAIVYAPTRKSCEELARALGKHFRAEAYHAGLAGPERDRVQGQFLSGKLDLIVATIAFGMGIDKADIRTVVHAGLPGSVEGYYQEIGRAGRDGLPARAVLLHSYADTRTHLFFFERDYPAVAEVEKVFRALRPAAEPREAILARVPGMEGETFDKALEKLWMHRGAVFTTPALGESASDFFARGDAAWTRSYTAQRQHRQDHLKRIQSFAESGVGCRMVALVRHFGDRADSGEVCGQCDACCPEEASVAELKRAANEAERQLAAHVLGALAGGALAMGRLFTEISSGQPSLGRRDFEELVAELARAGFVELKAESFERDGERIEFRRAVLTARGEQVGAAELSALQLRERGASSRRAKPSRLKAAGRRASEGMPGEETSGGEQELRESALFRALRDWRLEESRTRKVPAFRILADRVLLEICASRPTSRDELMAVRGLGPKLVEKYGAELLERVRGA